MIMESFEIILISTLIIITGSMGVLQQWLSAENITAKG